MNVTASNFVEITQKLCYTIKIEVIPMKLTYNISYPIVHTLALLALLAAGFARMLAWLRWFWVNDLVYILLAAAVLSGLWLAAQLGHKKELLDPRVLRGAAVVTHLLNSLQLALVCAWLVWDLAAPFLSKVKTFSPLVPVALLPVAAVNICAMVLQQKIVGAFGQTDEKS
jgi:hypothetical protein